ncbi:hypothetical protein [Acidisoma sp. 7E03]
MNDNEDTTNGSSQVQVIAKEVGSDTFVPIYATPFLFRGQNRTLEYTLLPDEEKGVLSLSWLRCDTGLCQEGRPCPHCPPMTQVEELAVLAVVAMDVSRPGDPLNAGARS